MALVRKILEATIPSGGSSATFTDSDIPNSLIRVYSTNSNIYPQNISLTGNTLTVTYEVVSSALGVAVELVKQGLEIDDNLTSDNTDHALSAKQGKVLKGLIDNIPDDLSELSDVDITDIEDGQVLAWDETAQKFVNVDQSGGGAASLNDLDDVDIISPVNDQYLAYSNGDWINKNLPSPAGDTVIITPTLSTGQKIADYSINSVPGSLYAPKGGGSDISYSTTETVIGEYLGKPLYRKVITGLSVVAVWHGTYYPNASLSSPVSNVKEVINARAIMNYDSGISRNSICSVIVNNNSNTWTLIVCDDITVNTLILDYTKTTD